MHHQTDTTTQSCIRQSTNLKVVDVLKFTDGTPVILLIHQSVTGRSAFPCKHWVEDLQRTTYKGTLQLPQIPATELEQKLLTTLLAMNAEHIPTDYRVTTRRTEYDFCTSFFLPVGPLSFEDVGKLNADTGCVVCGEKIASRCSRCLSVSYCSSGTWNMLPSSNIPQLWSIQNVSEKIGLNIEQPAVPFKVGRGTPCHFLCTSLAPKT